MKRNLAELIRNLSVAAGLTDGLSEGVKEKAELVQEILVNLCISEYLSKGRCAEKAETELYIPPDEEPKTETEETAVEEVSEDPSTADEAKPCEMSEEDAAFLHELAKRLAEVPRNAGGSKQIRKILNRENYTRAYKMVYSENGLAKKIGVSIAIVQRLRNEYADERGYIR